MRRRKRNERIVAQLKILQWMIPLVATVALMYSLFH
jgi:hypothetical protein